MEVSNNYYRVRNSYNTVVTPVSKIKPVINEKSVSNLIATSKVNDSVSISNTGRNFVNGLQDIQKNIEVEEITPQLQEENISNVSLKKSYTSIEDVQMALGMKPTREIEVSKPNSYEQMSIRKKHALSAYQKVMSYAPTVMSGSIIQSLL